MSEYGTTGKDEKVDVVLLNVAFTQLLALSDVETVSVLVQGLNLASKDVIFCAVSNSRDVTNARSGTHWSLLVLELSTEGRHICCSHFDSLEGSPNASFSRELGKKLVAGITGGDKVTVVHKEGTGVPSQSNAHDCGLYVLSLTDLILRGLNSEESTESTSSTAVEAICAKDSLWSSKLIRERVSGMRSHLLRVIDEERKREVEELLKKNFPQLM